MPDQPDIGQRFAEYRRTHDLRLRDQLVEEHRWIAVHCARRFGGRGEPMSDLVQVAALGVLKAVERFDPCYGVRFATFAIPTTLGELRRHFRDATWPVHVPRRAKELHLELAAAIEALHQELGRPPHVEELVEHTGLQRDEVRVALEANAAYRSVPLGGSGDADEPDDGTASPGDGSLGVEEAGYDQLETAVTVRSLLDGLPERERRIVELRFFEGRSQVEIGERVGLSQVHVSRVLRSSLDRLQRVLVR